MSSLLVPFCDQHFKSAKVCVDSVGAISLGLFYRSLEKCCWIFNQSIRTYYASLADYYNEMGKTKFLTYHLFGDQVIDFSVNYSKRVHQNVSSQKVIEMLKKTYTDQWIEGFEHVGTEALPLDKVLLAERTSKKIAGFCLGLSIDFIINYLQKTHSGSSSSEAAKSISPFYRKGAPDRAQLIHLFYVALNTKKMTSEVVSHFAETCYQKLTKKDPGIQELKDLEQLAKPLRHLIDLQRIELIAQKCNLVKIKGNVCAFKSLVDVENCMRNLANGSYLVSLAAKNETSHAMVLVKTDKNWFIYDPNFALLTIDPSNLRETLFKLDTYGQYIGDDGGVISCTAFELCC